MVGGRSLIKAVFSLVTFPACDVVVCGSALSSAAMRFKALFTETVWRPTGHQRVKLLHQEPAEDLAFNALYLSIYSGRFAFVSHDIKLNDELVL